jgi:hypothetical protein
MSVAEATRDDHDRLVAAFERGAEVYASQGSPLYAALSKAGPTAPEIIELTSHAMEGAPPVHLFTAVHYLLLGGTDDPLARFFPTLSDDPAPPEEAWPDFRRFCGEHADELRRLMQTRPVQMTYVERCRTLLPPLSFVAREAGEPLNLVEIGCSAGVLLTFDHYAYSYAPGEWLGPADAEIRLEGRIEGAPPLHMPRIGKRAGLDLNVIDARSPDDQRWMLATCFPELRDEQKRLAQAMAIVAETDIAWFEGDALQHIEQALADMPDPVCVYHSACLFYWPEEAKQALDRRLAELSRARPIWRIGNEPSQHFTTWQAGDAGEGQSPATKIVGETLLTRYRDGKAESTLLARSGDNFGLMLWNA